MEYALMRFLHILGAILIGAGLIGVFMADMRSRQLRDLKAFAESVRTVAVSYDGLVVPGAILLLGSGAWAIVRFHGGWQFLQVPWLAGMVILFALEFIEGNTITRLYFMRLRRLTEKALEQGRSSEELQKARDESLPTFTHFLDLPIFFLIVALGAIRPNDWTLFAVGSAIAITLAGALSIAIPRLYPWRGAMI
ncbi:MAG: DUF2269 family protein [Pseudomonadota bacterium]